MQFRTTLTLADTGVDSFRPTCPPRRTGCLPCLEVPFSHIEKEVKASSTLPSGDIQHTPHPTPQTSRFQTSRPCRRHAAHHLYRTQVTSTYQMHRLMSMKCRCLPTLALRLDPMRFLEVQFREEHTLRILIARYLSLSQGHGFRIELSTQGIFRGGSPRWQPATIRIESRWIAASKLR